MRRRLPEGPLGPVGTVRRHHRRHQLQGRVFRWFGASILTTGLLVALVMHFLGGESPMRAQQARLTSLFSKRVAATWDEPARRDELLASLATELDVDLVLEDAQGQPLGAWGQPCEAPERRVAVARGGVALGTVAVCAERVFPHRGWALWGVIGLVLLAVWIASGRVARRLSRPLRELTRVTEEIGAGELSSRAALGRHQPGEVGQLADAVNAMAVRIEQQLADQRELLAAVSHEIRTPLARLRVLAEMGRDGATDAGTFDAIDRELVELDDLVGQVLASSRLHFEALSRRPLDPVDLARRALERAGVSDTALAAQGAPAELSGDATLLARALANLLDNAARYGRGVTALRVAPRGEGEVAFEVDDAGPGIPEADLPRLFERFYRGQVATGRDHPSLGLGLALVHGIAKAHGGEAWAVNREGGGATVGFSVKG